MTTASFTISAFGDEIASDLESQLQTLNDLKIPCLELRAVMSASIPAARMCQIGLFEAPIFLEDMSPR